MLALQRFFFSNFPTVSQNKVWLFFPRYSWDLLTGTAKPLALHQYISSAVRFCAGCLSLELSTLVTTVPMIPGFPGVPSSQVCVLLSSHTWFWLLTLMRQDLIGSQKFIFHFLIAMGAITQLQEGSLPSKPKTRTDSTQILLSNIHHAVPLILTFSILNSLWKKFTLNFTV